MSGTDACQSRVPELLTACLQALDEGDGPTAHEFLRRAEELAAFEGALSRANTSLIAGMVEQETGNPGAALTRFGHAALTAQESACPDGARLHLHSIARLGALHRAQGDYARAEEVLLGALHDDAADRAPAEDIAMALNELGVVYKYSGRFDEAAACYRQALARLEAADPDSPELADIHHNIGGLAHARGHYAAAEAPARLAVTLRERSLGAGHPAVAADRAALAPILFELGQIDEAEHLLRDALFVFEAFHGPDHYETAVALGNLAAVLQRQEGHLDEVETCHRRALSILEGVLGPGHPELAPVLHNLAELQRSRNDHEAARALDERARAVLVAAVEPGHPTLGVVNRALDGPESTGG